MPRVVPLVILLALAVTSPSSAQASPDLAQLHGYLAGVKLGTVLRVQSSAGNVVEGPLQSVDFASLTLGTAPSVALEDVERIWQRGSKWKTGGFIGALVLGTAGLGLGLFANAACADDCGGVGVPVAGLLLGGAVGFGIGAGIGAASSAWHPRYP